MLFGRYEPALNRDDKEDKKYMVNYYQTDVKHKTTDVTGVVIAEYRRLDQEKPAQIILDVRGDDGKIYYGTPASNWTVVLTREDKEGHNEELTYL